MRTSVRVLGAAIIGVAPFSSPCSGIAQEDRGERIETSVTASEDRLDFTKSKSAPHKIESVFYQDLLHKQQTCKHEREKLAQLEERAKRRAEKQGSLTLLAKDQRAIAAQRVRVEEAEAAVAEAQRKANID